MIDIENDPSLSSARRYTPRWLDRALKHDVVVRSLKISMLVGSVLVLINQGDVLFSESMNSWSIVQVALTYCVPYCVSTYASVVAQVENA